MFLIFDIFKARKIFKRYNLSSKYNYIYIYS